MVSQQEYFEQDRLVEKYTAIVQPWLTDFAKNRPEIGTAFYSDVTILTGPHDDYFWNNIKGQKLNELYQSGKISIYYVKYAGASFIIEYNFGNMRNAYFMYKGATFYVPMDIAIAVKKLYEAQEYRSAIYGVLKMQSDYAH